MTQNQVGKQQNLQEFPQRDEKKDRVYRGLSQIVLVPRAGTFYVYPYKVE